MTDIKAAARNGDTQSLAQLMNQSFGSKGISVKVAMLKAEQEVPIDS